MKRFLALTGLTVLLLSGAVTPAAQDAGLTVEPLGTIDTKEDIAVVAAWAPDGRRLAYGTETRVRRRSLSADDNYAYPGEVWITEVGKDDRDRILEHDFLRGRRGDFFSFSVEQLAWSPNGRRLAVEITDERKNTATFLLEDDGDKIELGESSRHYVPGYGAAWLGDSQTLAVLSEALAPRLLHQVRLVRVRAGRTVPLFEHTTFTSVAWLPRQQKMVGVERDREFARTPRLVLGNLRTGQLETLEELSGGYVGGLQASPDETRVSYFVGQERLLVRSLEEETPAETWPVPFGRYEWAGNRPAVLYIEPEELGQRSGWLMLYDRERDAQQRLLPDQKVQDFWVAADGTRVAVLTVGLRPRLEVYRLVWPSGP